MTMFCATARRLGRSPEGPQPHLFLATVRNRAGRQAWSSKQRLDHATRPSPLDMTGVSLCGARRGPPGSERIATMSREILETFDNPHPGRDYVIRHVAPEFTSVCPKTHQPDFGTIEIEYVPDAICVELKRLKLYLQGYRNEGVFYEDVVNRILDDLAGVLKPRRMTVTGKFTPRGGMHSIVTAEYAPGGE